MLIEEKILDNIGKIGQINIEKAKNMGRKFFIGRICITDGIRRMGYSEESPELNELFEKFIKCDWGEGREDAQINEIAIATGYGDVMGVYSLLQYIYG